jgi:hypothetical protein
LPDLQADPNAKKMAEAMIAWRRDSYDKALTDFQSLLKLPEEKVDHTFLLSESISALVAKGDVQAFKELVAKAATKYPTNAKFRYFEFQIAFAEKRENRVQMVLDFVQTSPPSDLILDLVIDHWYEFVKDLGKFYELYKKYPLDYNLGNFCHALKCLGLQDFEDPLPTALLRSSNSDDQAYEKFFSLSSKFIDIARKEGKFSEADAVTSRRRLVVGMRSQLPLVEKNAKSFLLLARTLNQIELPVVAWYYLAKELTLRPFAGSGSVEVLEQQYLSCLNMGDQQTIESTWEQLYKQPNLPDRVRILRAMQFTFGGDAEEATRLITQLKKSADAEVASQARLIEVWLVLQAQGKEAALPLSVYFRTNPISAQGANLTIGIAVLSELEPAESNAPLINVLRAGDSRFHFVRSFLRRKLFPKLKANPGKDELPYILEVQNIPLAFPGCYLNWDEKSPLNLKVEDFKGDYKFQFTKDPGIPTNIDGIEFSINEKGELKGKTMKYEVLGKVDRDGNVDADLMFNGKSASKIFTRLVPKAYLDGTKPHELKFAEAVKFIYIQDQLLLAQYQAKLVGS